MKTKILSLIISAAACLGFAACDDDNWRFREQAEGSLSLASLKVDVDLDEAVISRADVSLENFIIDILDSKTNDVKTSYTYSSMPDVISVSEGDYKVMVRSHEIKDAEWDAPYYLGTSDVFSVKAGQITEIGTVKCKFSSIKVTVQFTDELKKYMDNNARVKVSANDRGSLDFTRDETRAGYFKALDGSSTLVAEFHASIEGNDVRALKTFSDVKTGQHYIITFSVKNGNASVPDEFGSIGSPVSGISIGADIAHNEVGSNASVSDEKPQNPATRPGDNEQWGDNPTPPGPGPEQPGPDDPVANPITIEPAPECAGLKLDVPNDIVDGASYKINIHSDKSIENLKVDITSDNTNFLGSAGEMLPLNFDLAHIDDPELENQIREDLELKCNGEVLGQNDVVFDVSSLVPLLKAFSGTHTFTITVTDQEGNTLSKKLILKAK